MMFVRAWRRFTTWLRRDTSTPPAGGRRAVLRGSIAGALGALFALRPSRKALAAAPPEVADSDGPKRRFGMTIDLDRCTSCNSCTIACMQENNIPAYDSDERYDSVRIEWMSMLWQESDDVDQPPMMLPFPCQHCEDAPCVKVCPVGATYKDSENFTVQVWDRCIGCRYCMVACPYGRRFANWETPKWDGTLVQLLNPDVATRPTGVVEKCTFCSHRVARVKEEVRLEGRALSDEDLYRLPACASACPAEAITFGDLNDPESRVARGAKSSRAFKLLEHLGTKPAVTYLRRDREEES
jgi:molybdopterin-containing oxidoreductase family iron-sulfur binding subunit